MKIRSGLLLGLCCLSWSLSAQRMAVQGTVVDSSGEPVIGANVIVRGSSAGVATDLDGRFRLDVVPDATLVVSYLGYNTQEVPVNNRSQITIVLQENAVALQEVVAIGYGTVRKSDATGSVTLVKPDEINAGLATSAQDLLVGKTPGVVVTLNGGKPEGGADIRIRGGSSLNATNDPLIVIDGVPVDNSGVTGMSNSLSMISPDNIESFTILKDASATAIYGSRASNGVIIITTKRGRSGKPQINFTANMYVNTPRNKVGVLDGDQFRQVITDYYGEGSPAYNLLGTANTNWQDEILRTSVSSDYNLSVGGTYKILPYRVAVSYTNQNGILKTSAMDRVTASITLNPKFFDNTLSVTANVKGFYMHNRFADEGAIGGAVSFDPSQSVRVDNLPIGNGYFTWLKPGTDEFIGIAPVNPVSLIDERSMKADVYRSVGNLQLDYVMPFLPALHANLNLGYDVAKTTGRNFVNSNSVQSSLDKTFTGLGQGNTWNNLRRNHLLDFYMNYAKNIESIKSNFDIMAGYSWQHFYYANHDITYSNPTEDLGAKEGYTYDENERHYIRDDHRRIPYENYLISFFGRLNYNFMDRYLLTATLRRDGSSRFSENNRWGLFPSAALAWTISNEPFMKATENVLSKLKLRLGYGVTGQQEIGDYQYITSYSFSTNPNTTYLGTTLLKPNGYSPDLKWEQTTTYNVAIDFGFLNNRINGSIEYYQKHTKDLLNTISAAAGTNFINLITANVGKMKNKGVEANVNAIAIQSKDFTWEVGYNITWNDSKITKLTTTFNPDYQGIDAGTNQKHQVGEMPGTFYLYQQVYDENGKPIQNAFVDRNNDGQITEADRYLTHKSPMAKVYMGFSSQFSYKKWDLGFNLRANFGNYVYNGVASGNSTSNNYGGKGFITNLYNGFQDTGFTLLNTSEQMASDYFLENASFLKMDNLTLGYSFQNLFAAKLSGRISASVQNVFTISKYSGLDPECGAIDSNIWPRPRTYTIGLNLNF